MSHICYYYENYRIESFFTIQDIEIDVWDQLMSDHHPFKAHQFLLAIENAYKERNFFYYKIYDDSSNELEGLLYASLEMYDLLLVKEERLKKALLLVRKIFPNFAKIPLLMTGCMETAGTHWWFSSKITSQKSIGLIQYCLDMCSPKPHLTVIRDFLNTELVQGTLLKECQNRGYKIVRSYPIANLSLNGVQPDKHLANLKSNCRKLIKRAIGSAQGKTYIRCYHKYEHMVDQLYSLYLSVHRRAKEYERPPIPKTFFYSLQKHLPESTHIIVLYDNNDSMLGYVLAGESEGVYHPFLFGKNDQIDTSVNVYYTLLWNGIEYASEKGIPSIDMGITNYFMKQTVGAELISSKIAIKMNNRFLNMLLSWCLPYFLNAPVPPIRKAYKNVT